MAEERIRVEAAVTSLDPARPEIVSVRNVARRARMWLASAASTRPARIAV